MPPPELRGLRILEVGNFGVFKIAAPEQTTFIWTGWNPADIEGVHEHGCFHLGSFRHLRRALAGAEFDLIVAYPPMYPPWHPAHVAAMLRRYRVGALHLLVRGLGVFALRLPTRTPIAVLDLADSSSIHRHNFFLLDRCRYYFKRELPPDHWKAFFKTAARDLPTRQQRASPQFQRWVDKIRPISLGLSPLRLATIDAIPPQAKSVDLFFAGQVEGSSTIRTSGLADLRALAAEGYRIDVAPERLPRAEFYARCARAWLTWSPEGYGWECFRHYEAATCRSVPVINRPSIHRHRPLRPGEHCLFYDVEEDGLGAVVRAALADRSRLAEMASAARAHVLDHHTVDRLGAHVARTCLAGG